MRLVKTQASEKGYKNVLIKWYSSEVKTLQILQNKLMLYYF